MIAKGQPILSEAPEELPANIARGQFRHFHALCQDCVTGGVCYQTYAAKRPTHTAKEEAACAYCGEVIWLRQQFAYDYSLFLRGESHTESPVNNSLFLLLGRAIEKLTPFDGLPPDLQQKFMQAGLGGVRGYRTYAQAAEFYRTSVPWGVRAQGPQAILDFLNGKHASHVQSFANNPHLAKNPKNIIWEPAGKNLRRGANDMSKFDKAANTVRNAAATGKAAGLAVLLELPVTAAENSIRVTRGSLSKRQAVRNAASDTGRAAVSGGAMTLVLASLKIGFVASALANPAVSTTVGVAGTGIFAVSAARRLKRAWQESPLAPLVLYFHPDCYRHYAAELCQPG